MGNSQTKESRIPASASPRSNRHGEASSESGSGAAHAASSRSGRGSRPDLSFLGMGGSSSNNDREHVPEVRRETKQEREVRKLEKERVARERERERSMKEEHVDGGYLVTQGVYTGTEDFSKPTVRQLMIERRVAPFWRGLEDFKETWTEHQLVAAARGLPIPAADEIPPEDPDRFTELSSHSSSTNMNNLTVPISGRTPSYGSDDYRALSSSNPNRSTLSGSSIFRPRSKTLASLTTSSKIAPEEPIVPQELQLPSDPHVNGQKIEAFLYKDATECPICFIYYPPYLNKTRCCDQAICSECFVQIKRPDPHPPEHADPSAPPPDIPSPEQAETLVSEPACCPYCQQEEFGVTYEHPQFKRGLTYANNARGSLTPAMTSSTSLESMGSPIGSPGMQLAVGNRRRTTSISANASTVITTDRIRPDWANKLANARNHAARRSAAATALHTAAYLMTGTGTEARGFGFNSRSRFSRNRDSPAGGSSGMATPSGADREVRIQQLQSALAEVRRTEVPAAQRSTGRRSRIDDLDDMMMMEAIRLSLAAEEERKKKEDKVMAKEAKKKAKEEKKQEKKEKKGMYSAGGSSNGGSALSLPLGIGRKRGNSGSSAYLREATLNSSNAADKGKGIDRGDTTAPITIGGSSLNSNSVTRTGCSGPTSALNEPEKHSHLRHMSNASASPASSFVESVPGSPRQENTYRNGSTSSLDTVSGNGTPLPSAPEIDSGNATPNPTEPMFNFNSLAAMIDREDEKEKAKYSQHLEYSEKTGRDRGESSASAYEGNLTESTNTLKPTDSREEMYGADDEVEHGVFKQTDIPEMMVTPVTPGAGEHEDKQLGGSYSLGIHS